MHRLFVAIRPPASVRARLLAAMGGVRGARWQDEGQLHLTLRYIGETGRHEANALAEELGTIAMPPFELTLAGIGAFERRGVPHTLWIGVEPCDALLRLQRRIERLCVALGLPAETRRYAPHVTLARLNAASGPIEDFVAASAGLVAGPWTVDAFVLYESHLAPEGSRYEPVVRYALDGSP